MYWEVHLAFDEGNFPPSLPLLSFPARVPHPQTSSVPMALASTPALLRFAQELGSLTKSGTLCVPTPSQIAAPTSVSAMTNERPWYAKVKLPMLCIIVNLAGLNHPA